MILKSRVHKKKKKKQTNDGREKCEPSKNMVSHSIENNILNLTDWNCFVHPVPIYQPLGPSTFARDTVFIRISYLN